MAADSMAKATIHEPVGTKDLWHHKGWQLPAYIQHVANDLRAKGRTESEAIRLAVGIVRNWSQGHNGNGKPVHADTQAAAAKAMTEWNALKAAANRSKNLTAAPTTTVDLTFAEDLHPRGKTGTPQGGRFVAKGSDGGDASPAKDTRDFQRRTGLAQTGKYDAATTAKVNRLLNPKGSGGHGKGKKTGKAATPAQKRASAARTASAVNGLNAAQRELYRAKQPTPPPGYRWTGDSRLVAVGASPEARAVRRLLRKP